MQYILGTGTSPHSFTLFFSTDLVVTAKSDTTAFPNLLRQMLLCSEISTKF